MYKCNSHIYLLGHPWIILKTFKISNIISEISPIACKIASFILFIVLLIRCIWQDKNNIIINIFDTWKMYNKEIYDEYIKTTINYEKVKLIIMSYYRIFIIRWLLLALRLMKLSYNDIFNITILLVVIIFSLCFRLFILLCTYYFLINFYLKLP